MPDGKYEYEYCSRESVRQTESRLRHPTWRVAYPYRLDLMQYVEEPDPACTRVEGEPREVRPQDMAIWRAILAGEERFAFLSPQKPHLRAARRALSRDVTLFVAQARTADAAGLWPRHRTEKLFRFVLFTHPFTGGRAVFSEPVD